MGKWSRRKTPDTLAPYFKHGFWGQHKILSGMLLALIGALYGFAFGVTATYFLVQMMIPMALVAILLVVLLPENAVTFERSITTLYFSFFLVLAVWPDYLALSLGALPWITATRLIAIPITLLFLVSLSQSEAYRHKLMRQLACAAPVWKCLLVYFVISFVTIAASDTPVQSVNKFIVAIYAWGVMFLVGVQTFAKPERVRPFAQILWVGLLFACAIGLWEFMLGKVVWADQIPSFLKVDDEAVAAILSGSMRAAIGEHRVQGKFTTPLGFAEFLALVTPFILHFVVHGRTLLERAAAALTLPLILLVIYTTDSRLGTIGFLLASFGYLFFWMFRRFRRDRNSLFAPLIILVYPALMLVLLVSSFFFTRLRNAVWGGGAYVASNDARSTQMEKGLELVLQQPWGHGIGQAAETLGFTNQVGRLTIDTYYISIALESGVIGFFAYYGAFLAAMWIGAWKLIDAGDQEETSWLLPTLLSLGNYLVIKSIFSQQDNHPLAFAFLGLGVALIFQVKSTVPTTASKSETRLQAI